MSLLLQRWWAGFVTEVRRALSALLWSHKYQLACHLPQQPWQGDPPLSPPGHKRPRVRGCTDTGQCAAFEWAQIAELICVADADKGELKHLSSSGAKYTRLPHGTSSVDRPSLERRSRLRVLTVLFSQGSCVIYWTHSHSTDATGIKLNRCILTHSGQWDRLRHDYKVHPDYCHHNYVRLLSVCEWRRKLYYYYKLLLLLLLLLLWFVLLFFFFLVLLWDNGWTKNIKKKKKKNIFFNFFF